MRKWLIALLAVTLALSWVPLKAAQAASIIKTEDGLEFKFGLVEKVQFYTLNGADFTENVPSCKAGGGQCNFRSFVSPDTNIGDSQLNIFNFTNLLFDLSKGPLSIHINLENEARIDENVADINHLNLERASLTYKTPGFGDLTIGFDVHLFDPEGGLVYQDEDPGIWLVGSQGMFSWNLGYHKRLSRNGGAPLGTFLQAIALGSAFADGRARSIDVDTDILEGRVGLNFGPILSVSPFFLANIRHTRQGGDLFACPTNALGAGLTCSGIPGVSGGRSEIYYPGVVVTSKIGPLSLTAEAVGQFGEIRELGASQVALYGKDKLDIESFAVFAEVALDLSAQGFGLTPYINLDYRRGDDSPLDGSLGGYVAISDLSQALRKDGFRLQSIQSLGAVTLGNGGEDGWGFNTSGRGVGPTIGTILEGLSTSSTFNSRFGKADNPGLLKLSAGVLGKVNSMWDTHIGMSYIRFDTVEPIKIEAALNRDSRLPALTPPACVAAGPANSGARAKCLANTLSVSEDAGVEFSFNVGYSPVPAFRIQPFVSVFVPLAAADDISRLFLSNDGSTRTAYTAGVEFRAQF